MKIIKTTHAQVTQEVAQILQQQQEACVYVVAEEPCVVVGTNNGADIGRANEIGIRVVNIHHEGGCIVISPGDVDIGLFTEGYYGRDIRDAIINKLIALLSANGLKGEIVDNDLLVNGCKVVGFGSRMYGQILYTAIHISVNANLDLIQQICTKPMKKIPGSLSEYGVNTSDVVNILMSQLKMYE